MNIIDFTLILFCCFFFIITNVDPSTTLKILRENYPNVCKQIAAKPDVIDRLTDTLHAEKFIGWDTQNAVKHTPGLIPYQKATRLLEPAIDSSTHGIDRPNRLIGILQEFNVTIQAPQEVTLCVLEFLVFSL